MASTQVNSAPGENIAEKAGGIETAVAVFLGLFLAVRLWVCPLASSFWLDETGTIWTITGGFHAVMAHLLTPANPQPPLYALLMWCWSRVAGLSEVALRLPSVMATSAAAVLLWRLALRITGRLAAFYTLVLLASLSPVSFAAADVRAYALAVLLTTWALFERILWIQTGRRSHLVRQGVAYGLLVATHYFFAVAMIADGLYLLAAHRRRWIRATPALAITPLIALVILLPFVPNLSLLVGQQHIHVNSAIPGWADLGAALIPSRWIVAGFLGYALTWSLDRDVSAAPGSTATPILVLLAFWAFVPTLIMFGYSVVSGVTVMIPRYLLAQAPAFVLLGGYAISRLRSPHMRLAIAAMLFLIAAAPAGLALQTKHSPDDWRASNCAINEALRQYPSTPVLMSSYFLESGWLPLPRPNPKDDFLLAPLKAYPVPGPITMLPMDSTPVNAQYIEKVFDGEAATGRFLVLFKWDSNLIPFAHGRLDRDFTATQLHDNPLVILFQRR